MEDCYWNGVYSSTEQRPGVPLVPKPLYGFRVHAFHAPLAHAFRGDTCLDPNLDPVELLREYSRKWLEDLGLWAPLPLPFPFPCSIGYCCCCRPQRLIWTCYRTRKSLFEISTQMYVLQNQSMVSGYSRYEICNGCSVIVTFL